VERDFEDSSRTRGLPRPRVAFPSFADWYALAGPWNVIAQAATQSELVTVTEAQVVTCGRARGIAVDPTKPIQSLMSDGQYMGLDAAPTRPR
jgi:hypothetical protein